MMLGFGILACYKKQSNQSNNMGIYNNLEEKNSYFTCKTIETVSELDNAISQSSNPQPPSKNDIELKEKEATQKKRLKEVKIATRRHKIPLPHNAT